MRRRSTRCRSTITTSRTRPASRPRPISGRTPSAAPMGSLSCLVDSRRAEERHRLGVAHERPAIQGQAGGAAIGRRRHPCGLAHAISPAAVVDFDRRPPVRPARGHRHLCRAEIRREGARAEGSDGHRHDQAAARRLREIYPPREREGISAMARLSGRTAIVTGGAKGIGRHYSRALAAEGARVMIADIADGRGLAEEIAAEHGANSVTSAVADVSDERAVKGLVAATIERFGKIDVLVNNAALFAPLQETKCTEIDAALWDQVMAVNLRGPFLMVKHSVPHMIARGYGKIINIGSGTALRGIPWMLHYVTSKGGIMAFTRALARELGEHGIRVNTLAPGFTLSDTVLSENPGHVQTARARGAIALAAARRASPGSARGARFPRFGGERLRDRPDAGGRRRQREYLICRPSKRR